MQNILNFSNNMHFFTELLQFIPMLHCASVVLAMSQCPSVTSWYMCWVEMAWMDPAVFLLCYLYCVERNLGICANKGTPSGTLSRVLEHFATTPWIHGTLFIAEWYELKSDQWLVPVYHTYAYNRSTQPCIPLGSLSRVPASAGVKLGMSPLPSGR